MDLNAGWTYTGVWKTEASKDDPEKMVSLFQVRKKKERLELVENLDEENKTGGKKDDINVQEVANVDDGKRPVVDQKQSFVD